MHSLRYKLNAHAKKLMIGAISAVMVFSSSGMAFAAVLDNADITLGDPRPGETTTYTASATGFTVATTIRCIQLDLGSASDGTGAISGIDTSSSTLSSNSITAGFAVDNTGSAAHQLRAILAGGATPNASGTIVWGGVVNGDTDSTTYYGVLSTFTDAACTTPAAGDDTVVMAFVYKNGTLVSLTIDPTLTFTCTGVASALTVNGETTTVTTSPGAISFGNVTNADTEVAAFDLSVVTNAGNGYTVYARQTGALTNANSDTIANVSGTHAAPAVFPALNTEGWGYTTQDSTSFPQFTANTWARHVATVPGDAVMAKATASGTGGDTVRVGHQVGISDVTPAGTYTTTLLYTVVATY